jgi:hypothetical protein
VETGETLAASILLGCETIHNIWGIFERVHEKSVHHCSACCELIEYNTVKRNIHLLKFKTSADFWSKCSQVACCLGSIPSASSDIEGIFLTLCSLPEIVPPNFVKSSWLHTVYSYYETKF